MIEVVQRPVHMFPTSINFSKRFLVPQGNISMSLTCLLNYRNFHQIMVNSSRSLFEHGTELILIRSNLFMPCFDGNSDLYQLIFCLLKHFLYSRLNFSIVVISQLLVMWWHGSDECSSSLTQVESFMIFVFMNKKELLLQTQPDKDSFRLYLQIFQQLKTLLLYQCLSFSICGLVIKCFSMMIYQ